MTNESDYVMELSGKILEIAVAMDHNGPPNILQDTDVFLMGHVAGAENLCHWDCGSFIHLSEDYSGLLP